MKQVLSQNIGLIGSDWIIEHPTMIFTDDNIDVQVFNTQAELVTHIAGLEANKFPPIPEIGEKCELNKIYAYGTDKAKCVQEHTRMHFTPEETPALWLVIRTVIGYPVWKQPTGAHDAYAKGDRVHFPTITDPVYESLIVANVWSPTDYPAGWKKL